MQHNGNNDAMQKNNNKKRGGRGGLGMYLGVQQVIPTMQWTNDNINNMTK
jgi:hypothetical protein